MGVLQLLASNSFITLNKKLMKVAGIEEAIIFGELCSNYEYRAARGELDEDESFYCTVEDLEDKTTFSEYKQRKAFKKLESLGLMRTKLKGMPPKRYIQISEQQIINLFDIQIPKNSGFKTKKNQDLNPEKFRTNNNTENKNTEKEYKIRDKEGYRGKVNNITSDNLNKEIKEQSLKLLTLPTKSPYGEFKNVFLSESEHKALIDRYGQAVAEDYIGQLDRYMQKDFAVKARYARKNHYAVVVDWVEKDRSKNKVTTKADIDQPFVPSSECRTDYWKDFVPTSELKNDGWKDFVSTAELKPNDKKW